MAGAAIPWIVGGVSALANLGGSAYSANKASSAAKTQSDAATANAARQQQSNQQALAFLQQMQQQGQQAQAPYASMGTSALSTLSSLMGQGQRASTTTAAPRVQAGGAIQAGSGGMVLMQAPDGSVNRVPAQQVQHYTSKGARVIGGSR